MSVTVTTKDELEKAITEKKEEIMVVGELAKKIKKANTAKKIAKGVGVGAVVAAGVAGVAAAPLTGGASLVATKMAAPLATAAATGGVAITLSTGAAVVGALAAIGLTTICLVSMEKDYEVEAEGEGYKFSWKKKSS